MEPVKPTDKYFIFFYIISIFFLKATFPPPTLSPLHATFHQLHVQHLGAQLRRDAHA